MALELIDVAISILMMDVPWCSCAVVEGLKMLMIMLVVYVVVQRRRSACGVGEVKEAVWFAGLEEALWCFGWQFPRVKLILTLKLWV